MRGQQHGQLNFLWPAKSFNASNAARNGASAEQHIVHQHDGFAGHVERHDGRVNFRARHADRDRRDAWKRQGCRSGRRASRFRKELRRAVARAETPPVGMPTSTTSAEFSFRSADLVRDARSARWIAAASRMTVDSGILKNLLMLLLIVIVKKSASEDEQDDEDENDRKKRKSRTTPPGGADSRYAFGVHIFLRHLAGRR